MMHWLVDLKPGSGECEIHPTPALANAHASRYPGARVLGPFSAEAVVVLARIISHVRDHGFELPLGLLNEAEDVLNGLDLRTLSLPRTNPDAETQPVIYNPASTPPAAGPGAVVCTPGQASAVRITPVQGRPFTPLVKDEASTFSNEAANERNLSEAAHLRRDARVVCVKCGVPFTDDKPRGCTKGDWCQRTEPVEHHTERKSVHAQCKECGAGLMLVQNEPFVHVCRGKS